MKKEAKNAANWNIFCKFGQILQLIIKILLHREEN